MAHHRRKAEPPEWEIDLNVIDGMCGGYRRIRDGLRLQRHARLGIWVLMEGQWVIDRHAGGDPPLAWADRLVPLTRQAQAA